MFMNVTPSRTGTDETKLSRPFQKRLSGRRADARQKNSIRAVGVAQQTRPVCTRVRYAPTRMTPDGLRVEPRRRDRVQPGMPSVCRRRLMPVDSFTSPAQPGAFRRAALTALAIAAALSASG